MAGTMKVTDADFAQEIEQHDGLAMVDFWAVWCGPCQIIAPHVEALATEYADKVKVAKLDVDQSPQTPARFGVRSIPSVLFFRGGELVDQVVGAVPKSQLVDRIEKHLR
ncbi:MAG: thioredoxin [Gemmatimonadota bacterium]|nr:thioredoxin [Gemmatimonadota bacterium]